MSKATPQTTTREEGDAAPVMIRPRDWMARTGMTTGETYRHLYAGRLRGVQVGRAWYIRASELIEFFEREAEAA